jgi:hypothetical protein
MSVQSAQVQQSGIIFEDVFSALKQRLGKGEMARLSCSRECYSFS